MIKCLFLDITWFPFDDQNCDMKFGSWTYNGFNVSFLFVSTTIRWKLLIPLLLFMSKTSTTAILMHYHYIRQCLFSFKQHSNYLQWIWITWYLVHSTAPPHWLKKPNMGQKVKPKNVIACNIFLCECSIKLMVPMKRWSPKDLFHFWKKIHFFIYPFKTRENPNF